ncbi:MAG: tRNA (adenosine(37)-N6)-dimethylallyltransferase MiaA [Beijerinckiaceae bacterium]|nr:tRNA (adenosine(37)-N6)-dimethylallyltransferase MiaA [Beijerinckiaceae bacterium]
MQEITCDPRLSRRRGGAGLGNQALSGDLAPAILIAGPTASGKSALAIRIAQAVGGVVVNADSMQVYRDLRIITARPTPGEEASVEHRLFGHVDAAVNYSVGLWLADAASAIADIQASGRPPVLVGGTGMYFKALTQGLSDIPAVPEDVRTRVRAQAEGLSPHEIHARLAALDPLTASHLRPTDPQRNLRALEVFEATGQPLASFQGRRQAPMLAPGAWRAVFLAPDRAELYRRIDERFDAMMEQGALDEVQALGARGLDPLLPAMRAHGVPGLLAWLRGEQCEGWTTREAAVERGKADTRRYAKRQFTFARHQLPDFPWASSGGEALGLLEAGRD